MITPADFLAQAERWIQESDEASWRSAVSRAYYAAHHAGRDLLTGFGFQIPRGPQAHSYIWMRLSNCGESLIELAGGNLNDLQRFRNQADYDIHRVFLQSHARAAVVLGRQIIERLAQGEVEPTRSQIIQAIRDYERNVLHQVTYQGP